MIERLVKRETGRGLKWWVRDVFWLQFTDPVRTSWLPWVARILACPFVIVECAEWSRSSRLDPPSHPCICALMPRSFPLIFRHYTLAPAPSTSRRPSWRGLERAHNWPWRYSFHKDHAVRHYRHFTVSLFIRPEGGSKYSNHARNGLDLNYLDVIVSPIRTKNYHIIVNSHITFSFSDRLWKTSNVLNHSIV